MIQTDLQAKVIDYLVETFEVERSQITLHADLAEHLKLDSIDAVDLMAKVQELTGRRVSPDEFKSIRTVQDVLNLVAKLDAKV